GELKITLLSEERIRLEGVAGPMTIEADSPEMQYSPYHMLASGMATCVYSVLRSWASNAKIQGDDLALEVGWSFVDDPHRVGSFDLAVQWPSLPEERRASVERAVHLCPVHRTFAHPPEIATTVDTGAAAAG